MSKWDFKFIFPHIESKNREIRKYGFSGGDIILDKSGNLELDKDPKEMWANHHPEFYPVRINKADKESLLRVPGLGPSTADIILKTRLHGKITRLEDLNIKGKRLENVKKYTIVTTPTAKAVSFSVALQTSQPKPKAPSEPEYL